MGPYRQSWVMRRRVGWLALIALCAGCSSYAVPRYGVAVTNVAALRQTGAQKISVQPFTATGESKTEIGCRAVGPVKTPDGRPFEEYVRKALIDELQVARALLRVRPDHADRQPGPDRLQLHVRKVADGDDAEVVERPLTDGRQQL